ncbi:hypothetical protein [Vibrio nereis]|uniref:Uncharacterized protein n=1 Tax=Vibrio nereis TaxID=693 RepID=A0A0M0HRU4_VIBNE|nr:hypothetical protein [Vibrio nereis]KOO04786.1 hypothetical protein AKJ17_03725 [Vibrio nereis]
MAVVPKHSDRHTGYDPRQDMTPEQLHRFGKVARKAQKRRDEVAEKDSIIRAAREAAFKPVLRVKREKPNTVRYAIWLVVVMVLSLWLMYMAG